jgi:hypothetical protein
VAAAMGGLRPADVIVRITRAALARGGVTR